MAANFQQVQQLLTAYGLQTLRAKIYAAQAAGRPGLPTKGGDYPDAEVLDLTTRLDTGSDDAQRLSYLGTPVFSDLILMENEQDQSPLQIDTVLFDVAMRRNIVTTAIQGRNGTVKEYISDGDYDVTIRGMLVEQSAYAYPADQVRELMRLVQLPQAIIAVSPFLQLFRIFELVVMDYRLSQREGFQNTQLFELNCVSDVPIELIEEDV